MKRIAQAQRRIRDLCWANLCSSHIYVNACLVFGMFWRQAELPPAKPWRRTSHEIGLNASFHGLYYWQHYMPVKWFPFKALKEDVVFRRKAILCFQNCNRKQKVHITIRNVNFSISISKGFFFFSKYKVFYRKLKRSMYECVCTLFLPRFSVNKGLYFLVHVVIYLFLLA